jgi:hypothetical protein
MATKKIEIQDSNGNVYYPHTEASVVKNGNTTVAAQLNEITNEVNQLSNPNLLINGDFQVWQRGESFNYIGNDIKTSNIYTADRWRMIQSNIGSTCYVLKGQGTGMMVTNFNKPSGVEMCLSQKFEKPLHTETAVGFTLSCVYSSIMPAKLLIRDNNNNRTLAIVEMPTSADLTKVECSFKSSDLSNDNKVEVLVQFPSDQAYTQGHINLIYVKLENGTVTTPCVSRTYAEEILLCKRYYQYNPPNVWFQFNRSHGGGLRCDIPVLPMRQTPTLIFPTDDFKMYNNASVWETIDKTKCVVSGNYSSQITLQVSTTSSGLADYMTFIAQGIPSFDSEIY